MLDRILVIEDNEDNLTLLDYLLRAHGYLPRLARNGADGIRIAADTRLDLVLLDIGMPGLNGFQVAAAIRSLGTPGVDRTRIVAVTASAMVGDRERIAAAGFDGYIQKPIDPWTLMATLEPFLAEHADEADAAAGKQ